jgi:hypothetical protein
MSPQTFYTQVIKTGKNIELLDCPGSYTLSDLIYLEKRAAIISTQHAAQQAKSINGIVYLINDNDLRQIDRFYRMMEAIENTIDHFYEHNKSILFLITRTNKLAEPKHIMHRLKQLVEGENKFHDNKTSANNLLNMIKNNPSSLQIFNPLIEEQRSIILERLQSLEPIKKEQFNIPEYKKAYKELNLSITQQAEQCIELFKRRKSLLLLSKTEYNSEENLTSINSIESEIDKLLKKDRSYLPLFHLTHNLNSDTLRLFFNEYEKYTKEKQTLISTSAQESTVAYPTPVGAYL